MRDSIRSIDARPIVMAMRVLVLGAALVLLAGVRTSEAQVLGYALAGPTGYSGFFGSSTSLSVHAAGGVEALIGGRVGAAPHRTTNGASRVVSCRSSYGRTASPRVR